VLTQTGQDVMEYMGQPPIVPPKADNVTNMPEILQPLVEEE